MKTREYNIQRLPYLPLKYQYESIIKYWGKRIIDKPRLSKEDNGYITFTVMQ